MPAGDGVEYEVEAEWAVVRICDSMLDRLGEIDPEKRNRRRGEDRSSRG